MFTSGDQLENSLLGSAHGKHQQHPRAETRPGKYPSQSYFKVFLGTSRTWPGLVLHQSVPGRRATPIKHHTGAIQPWSQAPVGTHLCIKTSSVLAECALCVSLCWWGTNSNIVFAGRLLGSEPVIPSRTGLPFAIYFPAENKAMIQHLGCRNAVFQMGFSKFL